MFLDCGCAGLPTAPNCDVTLVIRVLVLLCVVCESCFFCPFLHRLTFIVRSFPWFARCQFSETNRLGFNLSSYFASLFAIYFVYLFPPGCFPSNPRLHLSSCSVFVHLSFSSFCSPLLKESFTGARKIYQLSFAPNVIVFLSWQSFVVNMLISV